MALLADRLELPSVVKITSLDFDSAKDAAARESQKALSSASSASPVSLLSSLGDSNKSLLDEISGLFNSILCNGLMPFDLRLDNLLSRLLKQLGLNLDLGLGCLANGLLLDQILGKKPFSFFSSLLGLGNLSFSKQALLTAIFGSGFAKLMTLVGYIGSSTCNLNAANGLLNGNLGFAGMGLMERLNMLNMLNSNMGSCGKNAYITNNNNWTINKISNAVTINQMIMLDPAVTKTYLDKLMGAIPTMTTYDRTALLSGLGMSLNDATDASVEAKLKLLIAINQATTDATAKLLNSGTTSGVTGNVLTALNTSTVISTNPSLDLNNILLGLDTLDANWNVDPLLGETNYSVVSNNTRIVTLAKQATITTTESTLIDNEVIATPLSSFQVISLLSTVNEGVKNMNSLLDANGNPIGTINALGSSETLDANGNPIGSNNTLGNSESLSTANSLDSDKVGVSVNTYSTAYNNNTNTVASGSNIINANVIESAFSSNTYNSSNGLYNNTPLNVLYASNDTVVSCCLKSLCNIS